MSRAKRADKDFVDLIVSLPFDVRKDLLDFLSISQKTCETSTSLEDSIAVTKLAKKRETAPAH